MLAGAGSGNNLGLKGTIFTEQTMSFHPYSVLCTPVFQHDGNRFVFIGADDYFLTDRMQDARTIGREFEATEGVLYGLEATDEVLCLMPDSTRLIAAAWTLPNGGPEMMLGLLSGEWYDTAAQELCEQTGCRTVQDALASLHKKAVGVLTEAWQLHAPA
jgi:hypothetical protein